MFQGLPSMLVARGTPPAGGGGGITWTERGTENFFLCTAGQGHGGGDITGISANWISLGAGSYVCNGAASGGALPNSNASNHGLYYYDVSTLATQYCQSTLAVVPSVNNMIGPAVRVQSSGENAYFIAYQFAGSGSLILGKVNTGTIATIQSTAKSYSDGVKIRIEATGTGSSTLLTAYEDTGSGWVAVFTNVDPGGTYLDGGKTGLWASGATPSGTIDDWSGGDGV